jgi:DNA-binding NarL/FixJ family response regulator
VSDSLVPLSRREAEIAQLAAKGLASKEIADRLFLSVRTVSNHLQNVYTKLGVASRAELADALDTWARTED